MTPGRMAQQNQGGGRRPEDIREAMRPGVIGYRDKVASPAPRSQCLSRRKTEG
jgi:hypothetical protein